MNSIATPSLRSIQTKIPPLQALMQAWESEEADEPQEESESELMVMLSGMPGQAAFNLE